MVAIVYINANHIPRIVISGYRIYSKKSTAKKLILPPKFQKIRFEVHKTFMFF